MERFHEANRPISDIEAMVNEDGEITIDRLKEEAERRESLEYIRDAAEAFLPALESVSEVLTSRGKGIEDISTLIHIPTGSDRVARIMQSALELVRGNNPVRVGEVVHDRFTKQIQLEGDFSANDQVLIVDDSTHTGGSIVAASESLSAIGIPKERQIALAMADDTEGVQGYDLPIPCIVLDGDDAGRWSNRLIEGLNMPEFWPNSRSKVHGRLVERETNDEERELVERLAASDRAIGEEAAKQFLALNTKEL